MGAFRACALDAVTVLVALLAAGCGRVDGDSEGIPLVELQGAETINGDRLVRMVWTSKQGPSVVTELFYDRKREERCQFRRADDGELRCLPHRMILSEESSTGAVFQTFAGPDCEEPVVLRGYGPPSFPETEPALYGSPMGESSCGGISVHELGEMLDGPWYSNGEDCTAGTARVPAQRLGPRVPSSEFVRARLSVEGKGGLRAHRLNAQDGTAYLYGFWDAELDEACQIAFLGAERYACRPTGAVRQNWFQCDVSDPCTHCMDRVFLAEHVCEDPQWGLSSEPGEGTSVHEMMPWSEDDDLPEETLDCAHRAQEISDAPLWILGKKRPTDSFPGVKRFLRSRGLISSRLFRYEETGLELTVPVSEGLVDRKSGENCWLRRASDDTVRCFPHEQYFGRTFYYADPECLRPIFEATEWERLAAEEDAFLVSGEPILRATAFDGVTRIYEWGKPYEGPRYYLNGFYSDCEPLELTVGDSGDWIAAGEEIAPDRFVAYELKTADE